MRISLARFLSFIFNPVFLLVLVPFFVVLKSSFGLTAALNWTMYTIFFLLVMGVFIIYSVRRGTFTDMDVSKREQRPLLFLVSGILGVVYIGGLFIFQAPVNLIVTSVGILVGIILASLINTVIKASMHVATITAIIVGFVIAYGSWYAFLLLLIPILAWARLKIKRHTLPETIVGGLFGTALALGLYLFIKFVIN